MSSDIKNNAVQLARSIDLDSQTKPDIDKDENKEPSHDNSGIAASVDVNNSKIKDSKVITSQLTTVSSKKDLTFYFQKNDTFLHSIFGVDRGEKVLQFLHGKYLLFLMLFLAFSVAVLSTYFSWYGKSSIASDVILAFLILIVGMYAGSAYLAVNRIIFRLCLKSFDFWLKFLYGIRLNIAWYAYEYKNVSVLDIMISLSQMYLIVFMSTIEGFQFSKNKRIALTITISVVFSAMAYLETFTDELNPDAIWRITDDIQISLQAWVGSSYRVIAIFMWKQTLSSLIYRNKSSLLKTSPKIEYVVE